jgi:lipopolysaccharide/colanic/teichoic acid biosynthesis glycosyltransferase
MQRRTILVGTDKNTENLIEKMKKYVQTGFNLIGLISLSPEEIGKKIQGIPIVATLERMNEYIRLEKVNQVIFSTHNISYEMIIKSMSKIDNSGVEYKIVPQNLEVIIGKSSIERFNEYQFVDIDYAIGKTYNRIIKRVIDIFLSALILLIAMPVWILPVIFKWKNHETIFIWGKKGEKVGITQNIKRPFLGFLNRLFLILYIFIGRLSFVGAPLKRITERQPLYFYKPGIFGFLQLNYSRVESAEEEERYELFYLKNQNIWLDLEIILKSIFGRVR